DLIVTGVQTCALPIYGSARPCAAVEVEDAARAGGVDDRARRAAPLDQDRLRDRQLARGDRVVVRAGGDRNRVVVPVRATGGHVEIGRASCRERGGERE